MPLTDAERARRRQVCHLSWLETRRQVLSHGEPHLLCAVARFTLEQLTPLGLVVEREATELFTASRGSLAAQGVCADLRDSVTGGEVTLWAMLVFEHCSAEGTCKGRLLVAVTPPTTRLLDVLEQQQTGYQLASHGTKLSHKTSHSAMPYCLRSLMEQYGKYWSKESRFGPSFATSTLQALLEKLGHDVAAVLAM